MADYIILAGGWGRRLGTITFRRPKPLLPLAGRRILDYTLEEARLAGADHVKVIVDPRILPLRGVPEWVEAIPQPGPGIDNAIRAAVEAAGDSTLILSFTGYISRPRGVIRAALEHYSSVSEPGLAVVAPVSTGLETFGFTRLGMGGRIERVTRSLEEWLAGRGYVFAGVLIVERKLAERLAGRPFHEALDSIAREGLLAAHVWQGDWAEIAYPWDLLDARRIVLDPETTRISRGSRVHETAYIGPGVHVDEGAWIGPRAVVVGPSYIGRNARIEAGAIIASSIIEEKAHIGVAAKVVGSHVLEEARIGAGATVENSIIAEKAAVGANSVLEADEPGEQLPPLRGLHPPAPTPPKGVRLGPIIPPGYRVPACSRLGPLQSPRRAE